MTNEKWAIDLVEKMCIESLQPDAFEKWAATRIQLEHNRGIGNEDVSPAMETLKEFTGTDFKATGDDIVALHKRGTIGWFQLGDMMPPIPAFIHARHQYSGGWKYDLNIAVLLGDAWHVTRLYNIEEKYIHQQP